MKLNVLKLFGLVAVTLVSFTTPSFAQQANGQPVAVQSVAGCGATTPTA